MICSSLSWPNMFDVARNKVGLYTDLQSVANRVKLLMLTEPTELYMNPKFGLGLKKYLFTYNNDNVIAMIRDSLVEQLRLWEPSVIPEETLVERSGNSVRPYDPESAVENNNLNLTVTLKTIYDAEVKFNVGSSDLSTNSTKGSIA